MTYKIKRLNDYAIDIQLAGTTFRDPKDLDLIHDALKDTRVHNVKFRYQTDNPTDPNAIMVFINDIHAGYIPKKFCETFKKTLLKWKIIKRTAYMNCGCDRNQHDSYHIIVTVKKREQEGE